MIYSKDCMEEEKLLPKEPLDLPLEPKEIPKVATSAHSGNSNAYSHQSAEVKTLLAWHAPGRPFRKRGAEFYTSSLLIMTLVLIILFLFSQYLLMLVVISFVFVVFALATVPPRDFRYRISSEGITIEDHFFLWQELYDFYFKRRNGHDILHLRTRAFLPGELTITLGDMDKEHVKSIILRFLPYREVVVPTGMEKAADWLSKNFPLERHHAS